MVGTPDRWEVVLLLGNRDEVVEWELERALVALPGATLLEGEEEARLREEVREESGAVTRGTAQDDPAPALDVLTRPSLLPGCLEQADRTLRSLPSAVRVLAQPGLGLLTLGFDPEAGPETLEQVAQEMFETGARLRWRNEPQEIRATAGFEPPLPVAALELTARLKRALDPGGLFGEAPITDDPATESVRHGHVTH